jgi:hypothetical protein
MNQTVPRSRRVESMRTREGLDDFVALFLINEGDEKFPNLRCLAAEEHPDPPSHEKGSDASGRAYSSVDREGLDDAS